MNAASFVEIVHQGQKRKTGDAYTSHLYAVRALLIDAGVSEQYILDAALLHDCLEDGNISKEYLAFRFGPVIADIVDALSKQSAWLTSYCRMKSNLESLESAWVQYPETIAIKIADRLHNIRTIDGFPTWKQVEYFDETTRELLPLFLRSLQTDTAIRYRKPIQYLLGSLESEVTSAKQNSADTL